MGFVKLTLVFVEAALELVPRECWSHRAVISDAERRGKRPGQLLLDRSYHHAAMKSLVDAHKRGRPDIVHFCLLLSLGSVLSRKGLLEVYVHTRDDKLIWINPETRLPRVYERFKGLIEALYERRIIESDGKKLLEIRDGALTDLLSKLRPDQVVLMSEKGNEMTIKELGTLLVSYERPVVLIGAFPRGELEERTVRLADTVVRIHEEPLEAWTVTSYVICSLEHVLGY
ncbi:MAG: 16S rRNA methyltransferase [Nitrososphaerota archaeon]|nr:16S rRNA methyltransferase [Aigarchaeota archaeon]MDW8076731.1 16S rRNA methyltransferase [Nitrososphaerota archaeon]